MEENYLLAKKLVSQKYGDNSYYPLLVVSLFSLLEKYPDYYHLLIYLFLSTNIYIEDDTVDKILNKHHIDYVFLEEDDDEDTMGLSIPQDIIYIQDNGLICVQKQSIVICSTLNLTNTQLLNIFIHEMNHLVKGTLKITSHEETDDYIYYSIRNGLSIHNYYYNKDDDSFFENDDYLILDEVINTIQATELTSQVFSLKSFITDSDILNYLHSLSKKEALKDCGYEDAVKLFRPLWKSTLFRQIIEDDIVEGDISHIIEQYDSLMGDNSFEYLSYSMEIIDKFYNDRNSPQYKNAKKYIKNTIKSFPKEKVKVL